MKENVLITGAGPNGITGKLIKPEYCILILKSEGYLTLTIWKSNKKALSLLCQTKI